MGHGLFTARQSALIAACVVACSLAALVSVLSLYRSLVLDDVPSDVGIPSSLEDVRRLQEVLAHGIQSHFWASLVAFGALYTFKQTFCVPGSFALNLLAGALFGTVYGLLAVVLLTSLGTSLCFFMASYLGCHVRYASLGGIGHKVQRLETTVSSARRRGALFYFLLSVRVFPLAPQWLVTLVSPLAGVPFPHHAASIFLGLLPYNFLTVRAGTVLHELNSSSDAVDGWAMLQLGAIALLAVVPTLWKQRASPPPRRVLAGKTLQHVL